MEYRTEEHFFRVPHGSHFRSEWFRPGTRTTTMDANVNSDEQRNAYFIKRTERVAGLGRGNRAHARTQARTHKHLRVHTRACARALARRWIERRMHARSRLVDDRSSTDKIFYHGIISNRPIVLWPNKIQRPEAVDSSTQYFTAE